MPFWESGVLVQTKGCPRCGNKKFVAKPPALFPYCEECIQCSECGGAKIVERVVCVKCDGRGYTLKNVKAWGPLLGGEQTYDEESDDFFVTVEDTDKDIEAITLADLADEEFAEFADDGDDGDDAIDLY